MSKTPETKVYHCLLLYSFKAYLAQERGSVKTFLHVLNSTEHSWPFSIVIFIQCIFSTRVGVCQNIFSISKTQQTKVGHCYIRSWTFSTRLGLSQNISACPKLNRSQLAIVYCYIHSGHIWHRSSGDVSKRFYKSKTQ